MTRRMRRNHLPEFKAKVAIAAMHGDPGPTGTAIRCSSKPDYGPEEATARTFARRVRRQAGQGVRAAHLKHAGQDRPVDAYQTAFFGVWQRVPSTPPSIASCGRLAPGIGYPIRTATILSLPRRRVRHAPAGRLSGRACVLSDDPNNGRGGEDGHNRAPGRRDRLGKRDTLRRAAAAGRPRPRGGRYRPPEGVQPHRP